MANSDDLLSKLLQSFSKSLKSQWSKALSTFSEQILLTGAVTKMISETKQTLSALEEVNTLLNRINHTADSISRSQSEQIDQTSGAWEKAMNRLSDTWADTMENIAASDSIAAILNRFNKLLSVINQMAEKLGSLGNVSSGARLLTSLKNVGRDKMLSLKMSNCLNADNIVLLPTAKMGRVLCLPCNT